MSSRSSTKLTVILICLATLMAAVSVLTLGEHFYRFFADGLYQYYFSAVQNAPLLVLGFVAILLCGVVLLVCTYRRLPGRKREKVDAYSSLIAWAVANVCLTAAAIGAVYAAILAQVVRHELSQSGLTLVPVSLGARVTGHPVTAPALAIACVGAAVCSWWWLLRKVKTSRPDRR